MEWIPFVAILERLDLRFVEHDEGCMDSCFEPLRQHRGKDLPLLAIKRCKKFIELMLTIPQSAVAFAFQSPALALAGPIWPWPSRQCQTRLSITSRYC